MESSSFTSSPDHLFQRSFLTTAQKFAESAVPEQARLAGDSPPSGARSNISDPDEDERLYVMLTVRLPVQVETTQLGIQLRADWERMYWGAYTAIAGGLRKLLAGYLEVGADALAFYKVLMVVVDSATQCVEIVIPKSHAAKFTSVDIQSHIKTFLSVLMGDPLPCDIGDAAGVAREPDAEGHAHHLPNGNPRGPSLAIELAREVRAAVGGTTLPAACTIEGSGWEAPLPLSGRLGEKPRPAPSTPRELTLECRLDGYIKSQRVVHLLPMSTSSERVKARSDGRKIVAYDEERWFRDIASLASERGQIVRATYLEVIDGTKQRLELTNLEAVARDENHTR